MDDESESTSNETPEKKVDDGGVAQGTANASVNSNSSNSNANAVGAQDQLQQDNVTDSSQDHPADAQDAHASTFGEDEKDAEDEQMDDGFQVDNILDGLDLSGNLIQQMYGQPSTYNDQDNVNAPSAMDTEAEVIDQSPDNSGMNQQALNSPIVTIQDFAADGSQQLDSNTNNNSNNSTDGVPSSNSSAVPPSNFSAVPPSNSSAVPPSNSSAVPPSNFSAVPPSNYSAVPPSNSSAVPPRNSSAVPPSNSSAVPPSNSSAIPPSNSSAVPPSNSSAVPPSNFSAVPPSNSSAVPPNNSSAVPPSNSAVPTASAAGTSHPAKTVPKQKSTNLKPASSSSQAQKKQTSARKLVAPSNRRQGYEFHQTMLQARAWYGDLDLNGGRVLRKRTAPPGDSSQKKKPKQARKTPKAPDTKKGDGAAPGGGGAAHGGDGAVPRL